MEYNRSEEFGSFSNLFRSETRKKLLLLFFLNAEREYYLRELERLLGVSAGNIRREILKLEKDNIINFRRIGNIVLYQINTKNKLYNELKKVVLYSVGVQELLAPVFNIPAFKTVFIYGSYAKGELDFSSDIDVFALTDNDLTEKDYLKINKEVEKIQEKISREISLDIYSRMDIVKKKSGEDPYLLDVLKGKKIFIKEGGESELQLLFGSETES